MKAELKPVGVGLPWPVASLLILYSSALGRTATVVGQRGHVDDFGDFDAGAVYCADSRFTAVTRALEVCLHFAEAEVVGYLGTVLSGHLGGIGSVLLGATEAHLAGRRPADDLSFAIGKANDDVVERRVYVKLAFCADFDVTLLCCDCFFCHID